MNLFAAASALTPFFPAIAQWISGDDEKRAQDVLAIAKTLTGTDDPLKVRSLLAKDPNLLLQFQKNLFELEKTRHQEETRDRTSARNRDMALMHAGRQNLRADIMVIAAALGLGGCLLALAFYRENLPGEAVGIISTVAGIFGSCLKDAYAFEFGSSRGSKDKDQRVRELGG